MVITTLFTSLHDTTMEVLNPRSKIATESFENIIKLTKKILQKVDKILEILLNSYHNIVTMIIASIVSISSILGLTLIIYIIKIVRSLRQREEDTDKLVKESYGK